MPVSATVSTRTEPSARMIVRCLEPSPAFTVVSVSTPGAVSPSVEPVVSVMVRTLLVDVEETVSTLPASVCEGTLPLPSLPS